MIEVRRLVKRLGGRPVLRGLDLAVAARECVAVAGPNGAGKTTLLKALARLMRPRQGRVLLAGRSAWELPHRQVARWVAFVPQQETPAWELTVEEVVALGRLPHRQAWWRRADSVDTQAVEQALQAAGLAALRHRPVGNCPGASSAGLPWPGPWPSAPECCCWTSPRRPWTWAMRSAFWRWYASWPTSTAWRW